MKVLITSGGCKVPIDEVRHIGNFSSGRYGAEIAKALFLHGNTDIIFFNERGSKTAFDDQIVRTHDNSSYRNISYKDYFDYLNVKQIIATEKPDIIISAAAISDYICDKQEGKISSDGETMNIQLRKAEKVIASFRELAPQALIVGFKCLVSPTDWEKTEAVVKQFKSGVDYVVYNDLTELRKGNPQRVLFGTVNTQFVTQDLMANSAKELVDYILERNPK